jgi:preprotein translocase subunit SecG
MLHTLLVIIHLLVCVVLTIVVLLQASKGGGLAGAFGGAGGAPQQLLGTRGMTTLLHKMTIYLAVAFFLTSFMLFMFQGGGRETVASGSVLNEAAERGELNVPVTDVPAPADTPVQQPAPATGDDTGGN